MSRSLQACELGSYCGLGRSMTNSSVDLSCPQVLYDSVCLALVLLKVTVDCTVAAVLLSAVLLLRERKCFRAHIMHE
jgi:hypothetical protein